MQIDFAILPRIIAHRGASGYAPENTLKAFRAAKQLGAKMVEFDVGLSKDNVPVVIHDDTLDRTTNAQGLVRSFTLSELKKFNAGDGEHIPSLEETLACLVELKLSANVEIKPCPGLEELTVDVVVPILKTWREKLPLMLVSSFDLSILHLVKNTWSTVNISALFERLPKDYLEEVKGLDCVSINLDQTTLGPELVKRVHDDNYKLLCYTVNDAKRATELFAWGVDGVFTNYVDVVQAGLSVISTKAS